MDKDELKNTYFSFYDQLLPEHRDEAKRLYDGDWNLGKEPTCHQDALSRGWEWSEDQWDYWDSIRTNLCLKTYPLQLTPQVCEQKAKEFMRESASEGKTEDILEEALRITGGDRMNDYGPPDQDFRRTAIMWEQLLNCRIVDGVLKIQPKDVATCMIALKLSRETHQAKRDNFVDIAGYARCGALCEEVKND